MALAVVALMVGGITWTFVPGGDGEKGPIVDRPEEMVLGGVESDAEMYVLSEAAYGAAPSVSLLWRRAGITMSIGGGSESGLAERSLPWEDPSRISSEIAVTFWDRPERAIVVGNYTNALRMVPAAAALDAPLLIWGETTLEALWTLGTVRADDIVVCGDTPLNVHHSDGLTVLDDATYLDWTLALMAECGPVTDYLVVTNPMDVEGAADVPHLSAYAGLLAVHRDAVLLTAGPNGTEINASIHEAYRSMEAAGFEPHYLCMVGDADALRFMYRHFDNYDEDGMPSENPVPADNWYTDLDGEPFTMEVAGGRLIAKSLPDMGRYLERLLHYEGYLATRSAPAVPVPELDPTEWNNNALVYCAAGAEFDVRAENEVWKDFYFEGGFNTKDASPEAHGTYSGQPAETNLLVARFSLSNFIAIDADHGNPGSTVTFDAADLRPMHPGVTFAVSCNLGRIDDLDERGYSVESSICYTFMEMGLLTYVAPTRVTYGVISSSTLDPEWEQDDNKAANGLCRLFYEKLIEGDMTVGKAFQGAVNDLFDSPEWDEAFNDEDQSINLCVIWEYHVYGDPAFDPYEPANEG